MACPVVACGTRGSAFEPTAIVDEDSGPERFDSAATWASQALCPKKPPEDDASCAAIDAGGLRLACSYVCNEAAAGGQLDAECSDGRWHVPAGEHLACYDDASVDTGIPDAGDAG
ncbi:MAG: hypothetical protein ABI551_06225 [Polyangiaceae bacterium]